MSVASVYRIIADNLKMRKVANRWVPHHLSDEQKVCRQRITEELLHHYQTEGEEFLKRTVALDLFLKLKKTLRGKCFATIEEASTEVT